MKKFLILFMLLDVSICFGQESPALKAMKESTLKAEGQIKSLCLIKRPNKPDTLVAEIFVRYQDYTSQKAYPDPAKAIKKYGTKSIIIINLKPGIQLVNLEKVISDYKISPDEMKLPVYIDNYKYRGRAKDIAITTSSIKSANISKDGLTNEKYIDVRTGGPIHPKKQKIII